MKLTTEESASIPAVVGFIKDASQEVADWLFEGLENGEPLPDDIKNVEAAAQYMRSYGVKHGPYPEGSKSMADKITEMIKAAGKEIETNPFAPISTGGPSIKSIEVTYRKKS